MDELYLRTRMLVGDDGVKRLQRAHVAVFGLGGVGGHAAEALARAGVGRLTLVDGDTVAPSNLNRQLVALHSTLGQNKAEVMARRAMDINPDAILHARTEFFTERTRERFCFSDFDYVVDAIDMVSAKLMLAECCRDAVVPLISCMGTGNKLDPQRLTVADIYDTQMCPLARVMRRELRARAIDRLKVVYSLEPPLVPGAGEETPGRRQTPGSVSFVPAAAGILLAAEVLRDLCGVN